MLERMRPWIWKVLMFGIAMQGCTDNPSDEGIISLDPPFRTIDSEPDWSPDGNVIAYNHSGICLLHLQSMSKQFLTEGWMPKWSPDAKKIAYVKNNNIHVIDVQSKQISQLTTWGESFFPSWSPDGKKIAFDTNYGDSKGANVIWVMNADGSGKKDISQHGTGEWRQPVWSKDGTKILHLRYIGFTELFLMDTTGSNPVRLTFNSFDDRDPSWSPDGSKIAWGMYGSSNNTSSGIWTMNKDGTNQKQIVRGGGYPSWSPDGTQIVYYHENSDGMTGTLWIMNSDGTNQRQLTSP
jgi:TolB protein